MKRIVFATFNMGDVEDPEIYIAQPIYEFQQTPKGRWMMENCKDPVYQIGPCPETYGYRAVIYGDVEEKLATEFYLRW